MTGLELANGPRPARCVLPAAARLGECPVWSQREQVLYWVDISARELHRFDPSTGLDRHLQLDEDIGCFGLRRGGGFIAGLRSGIWLLDAQGRRETRVEGSAIDGSVSRFNDGRCDSRGRFWAGTLREPRDLPLAALYRVNPEPAGPRCERVQGEVMVSNGLAFSPDGRTMYQSDTPAHVLYAYDCDPATGATGPRRVLRRFPSRTPGQPYGGRPDGAAVDAAGNYWSAQYEGGRILCLDVAAPGAPELCEVRVPALRTTMCAFGGPDLQTLYITSARQGAGEEELRRWPESGGLFAVRLPHPGREEPLFEA